MIELLSSIRILFMLHINKLLLLLSEYLFSAGILFVCYIRILFAFPYHSIVLLPIIMFFCFQV